MKTSLKVVLPLAAVVTSVYFFNAQRSSSRVSDLLLQNIEALAKDENPSVISCGGTGSVNCPINGVKVKYVSEKRSMW